MLSNLPPCGKPTRVMIYDLHTLQNRFYLYGHALASLHTTIPLICERMETGDCAADCIAFPDDGAAKRFTSIFADCLGVKGDTDYPTIICGKVRDGEARKVTIQEGNPAGKHVLIVDDLVRSGGTLFECAKVLLEAGASKVSVFVAHAAFPRASWERFLRGGDRGIFEQFYTTNSVPHVTRELPVGDVFVVLDVCRQIIHDL